MNPLPDDSILDVGFADREFSQVDNYLERHYPWQSQITALGIRGNEHFSLRYPDVRVVLYDGKTFPFPDKTFEIGWSNAVIEHVGNEDSQLFFVKELVRTCKKVYFTTPNRFFPVEVHTRIPFLHWLPKKYFDKILSATSKYWAAGDYMHLLSKRKLKNIFKKAGITNYRIFHNKLMGFTMDFSIIID